MSEVYRVLGLKGEEYDRIVDVLGRKPNFLELAMYSVMWSEHCAYKHSKPVLTILPTQAPHVLQGPGENAGVIDIGDGLAVVFKVESHNHPSAIEPFQGAATGVGGIIRDILAMGARPIALLDSLCFGSPQKSKVKYLLEQVVAGISAYGNCLTCDEWLVVENCGEIKHVRIGEYLEKFIPQGSSGITKPGRQFKVLSYDPLSGRVCWRRVTRIFKKFSDRFLKISTTMGRTLKVTPDHPTPVFRSGELCVIKAAEVNVGDELPIVNSFPTEHAEHVIDLVSLLTDCGKSIFVKLPRKIMVDKYLRQEARKAIKGVMQRYSYLKKGAMPLEIFLKLEKALGFSRKDLKLYLLSGKTNYVPAVFEIDSDFARLVGYYLSEGCISKNGSTFKIIWVFGKREKEYAQDVCNILRKYHIRFSVYHRKSTIAIYLSSWIFAWLIKSVLGCGNYAHRKSIPEALLKQSKEIREELLKGLFRGDASVRFPSHPGSKVKITFSTVSEKLYQQVILLLQDFGITPYLYKAKPCPHIQGRIVNVRQAFRLEIQDYSSISKAKEWFSSEVNQRIAQALNEYNGTTFSFPRHKIRNGLSTVKVRKIEEVEDEQFVYDIEVEDTHLFVTTSGIITHNCVGVPTVGGEVHFEDAYEENPLVNVMCMGLAECEGLVRGIAKGAGNLVILIGSKTGRDGIGGVSTLASREFGEEAEEKRPSVQVGDPFTEKLLIEACLELVEKKLLVGLQDLGGAGLTCATCETASRARMGMDVDVLKVPRRERDMKPWEVMISESQERMLAIATPENLGKAIDVCRRWGLDATVVGKVTNTGILRIFEGKDIVGQMPARSLAHDAPIYYAQAEKPSYVDELQKYDLTRLEDPSDFNEVLLYILSSPNICSRKWIYEQYDHMVQVNTVVLPGSDASVLRIKGTNKGLALTVDCNGRYCYLDPFVGAKIAVAEAARNLVCSGAKPLAVSDCLNFGSPEKPEIFWQFREAVRGLSEACTELGIPVVSGNVSFYNESFGEAIYPTPTVGMVGILEDISHRCTLSFKEEDSVIALLGITLPELGGSEYLKVVHNLVAGSPPILDMGREIAVQRLCLKAIQEGLILSAHDCSEGGLAVTLAECCIIGGLGAMVRIQDAGYRIQENPISPNSQLPTPNLLFSESQSRIIVSLREENLPKLEKLAREFRAPVTILGRIGGNALVIDDKINLQVSNLARRWQEALECLVKL